MRAFLMAVVALAVVFVACDQPGVSRIGAPNPAAPGAVATCEPPVPPPTGEEGCTPGFWKNHLELWSGAGYSTTDNFDTVFGTDYFDPDITLLEAINLGGGGVRMVARHGAAALLSAAHPDVAYPYTLDQVIAAVQAGDGETLAAFNELGCPID